MPYDKKEWKLNDTVMPEDLNRIEDGITNEEGKRTVADAELADQINRMLPKIDACMQDKTHLITSEMTKLSEIRETGIYKVSYIPPEGQKGSKLWADWPNTNNVSGLMSVNRSANMITQEVDATGAIAIKYYREIINDVITSWQQILTDQTGVKKSGDIMGGNLSIKNGFPQVTLKNELNMTNIVNTSYCTHIQDWKSENKHDYVELLINASATENSKKLVLHIPNVINSYIYGGHNPPYVTGRYTGDGTNGRQIAIGFIPTFTIVSDNGAWVHGCNPYHNGFAAEHQYGTNVIGVDYSYIAFK